MAGGQSTAEGCQKAAKVRLRTVSKVRLMAVKRRLRDSQETVKRRLKTAKRRLRDSPRDSQEMGRKRRQGNTSQRKGVESDGKTFIHIRISNRGTSR
ncbi:MAG: hypothetical protein HFG86_04630 [Dorea sp.]|nr:hypothetical protein [Dorea sp.]